MSNASGWRVWASRVAVAVMIAAAVVGYVNGRNQGMDLADRLVGWMRPTVALGYSVLRTAAPAFLAACLLLGYRRFPRLAWGALALCISYVILEMLSQFTVESRVAADRSLLGRADTAVYVLLSRLTLIALLLLPRLDRKGTRIQVAAVVSIALSSASELLWWFAPHVPVLVMHAVSLVLTWGSIILVPVVGYLGLFRRVPAPHRPPVDAADTVAMTCPRCSTQQVVRTGGGECSNCRLQIFIGLEEGRCRQCGYLLRGLTGGRCPECGTAISTHPGDANAGLPASNEAAAAAGVTDEVPARRS